MLGAMPGTPQKCMPSRRVAGAPAARPLPWLPGLVSPRRCKGLGLAGAEADVPDLPGDVSPAGAELVRLKLDPIGLGIAPDAGVTGT